MNWADPNGNPYAIVIDAALYKQFHAIVKSPGSYYAYGRFGNVVISPRDGLVFYIYTKW